MVAPIPAASSRSSALIRIGVPFTSTRHLGFPFVSAPSRLPSPAASTMACGGAARLSTISRSSDSRRWRQQRMCQERLSHAELRYSVCLDCFRGVSCAARGKRNGTYANRYAFPGKRIPTRTESSDDGAAEGSEPAGHTGASVLSRVGERKAVAGRCDMAAVTTYLDFGMTKGGKRTCYDYREDQPAYDLFMGARYLRDLIAYREGNADEVYHPEDVRDTLRK